MAPALILQALIAIKNRVILIASGFSLFRTGTLPSPCAARKTTENRGNLSPSNWPTGHRHPKMFEMPLFATAAVLLSYLLGCLNAGYYYGRRVHRQDIRLAGSGTAGARNAGRLFGKRAFALVFLGDAAKGAVATGVGLSLGPESGALCAVAVVLGHIWPAQLGFRGGKGIASALGSLLLLAPWLLALMAVVFALLKSIGQSSSHAGIAAFWVGAAGSALLYGAEQVAAMAVLALLLTISHLRKRKDVARPD